MLDMLVVYALARETWRHLPDIYSYTEKDAAVELKASVGPHAKQTHSEINSVAMKRVILLRFWQ